MPEIKPLKISIEDPFLRDIHICVQDLRQSMRECYVALTEQGTSRALSKAEWTAVIVLSRAVEAIESTELLLGFNRCRDAAILLLAILELEYDLQYISIDHSRAETWLSHSKRGSKPWRIADLQAALYPEAAELESVKFTYRELSAIKHGNPVSGLSGFPICIEGRNVVYKFDSEAYSTAAYLFVGGTVGTQISKEAVACFQNPDEHVRNLLASIQEHSIRLTKLFEKQIVQLLTNSATIGSSNSAL
jgi:hypothetical protein